MKKKVQKAVELGRDYLISLIENDAFHDKWYGDVVKPPVEKSISPMLCFFAVLALEKCGGIPKKINKKILGYLSRCKKNDSYAYDEVALIDSDDTAFALRTLNLLGESVSSEIIQLAFKPFECKDNWFTFPAKTNSEFTPRFHHNYSDKSSVIGPHPEVYLNILNLFLETGIPVKKVLSIPESNGLPISYFYDSNFYGAWLYVELCKGMGIDFPFIKKRVHSLKFKDGGWPSKAKGFSSAHETALALLILGNNLHDESISFLLDKQREDGAFPGGNLWRHRLPNIESEAYWYAEDINSIVSTGISILALIKSTELDNLE